MSLVEYHDPDGLFPLVSPQLLSRLPLKNLHWKSATRPLRTISSLQVDFVPAISSFSIEASNASRDSVGSDGRPSLAYAERGRRHQIPGLQQTPFLKLYLLRCDDKDAYKAASRKVLRDWLKDNVPESQSSDRVKLTEAHDAFEWLIVHVVLPDTFAATQPRFSKTQTSNEVEGSRDRSTTGSKWPGRGSRTILEKLRADFNSSSKSSLDRVAQIRLQREVLPERWVQTLSASGLTPFPETPQDRENALSDVIGKLKTLILTSFTLRVNQYEDDIRERDSQRALPGWNFCTFFVLKEGLAKSFESVGLTEDALVIYDELSVGLDTTVREQSQNQTSALSPFTPELYERLRDVSQNNAGDSSEIRKVDGLDTKLLSVDRKDYRALIVSSNISLYDFRCYVFCRQKSLLLRLACMDFELQSGSKSATNAVNGAGRDTSKDTENAVRLSDLSQRTAQFVTSVARTMRDDIWAGIHQAPDLTEDLEAVINTTISSWTFSVLQQVLDESFSLSIPMPATLRGEKAMKAETNPPLYPQRQSSLAIRSPQPTALQIRDTNELFMNNIDTNNITDVRNIEVANWMANRADLYLLQKRILEGLGLEFDMLHRNANNHSPDPPEKRGHRNPPPIIAVEGSKLRKALSSSANFHDIYELVTDRAAWFYSVASRKRSAEKLLCDLAKIKQDNGDCAGAAQYFAKAISTYELLKWHTLETSLLKNYAKCLKILDRRDEYVKVVLAILAKSTDQRRRASRSNIITHSEKSLELSTCDAQLDDESLGNVGFTALAEYSAGLSYDHSASLLQYFEITELDTAIQLLHDEDGFQLSVTTRQLIANEITLDSVKVRLVEAAAVQGREIWLESRTKIVLGSEPIKICVQSNTTTIGDFVVDKIMFQAGKILFVNETVVESKSESTPIRRRASLAVNALRDNKGPHVFCYPRAESLQAEVQESSNTRVGEARLLHLRVRSGQNDVMKGKIILRSASAGLRLHTAEAAVVDDNLDVTGIPQPGEIDFGNLGSGHEVTLAIPYSTEQSMLTLSLRMEVRYSTSRGDYVFAANAAIKPLLLLDVNVQDIFRETSIYSKFQLRSVDGAGLHLLDAKLEGSTCFEAQAIMSRMQPATIFPNQAVVLSYRISRKSDHKSVAEVDRERSLLLAIRYRHVEDDVSLQSVATLEHDLKESPFAEVRQLILYTFKEFMRRSLAFDDYERAASLREIHLPALVKADWSIAIKSLSKPFQQGLLEWLQDWYNRNSTLSLLNPHNPAYVKQYPARQLIVKVDVPELQFLHTASLHLLEGNTTSTLHSPVTAVGQPLAAELRIRYTRRWSSKPPQPPDFANFTYEIHLDPSQWLLGGQRRVQYTAKEDETPTFGLILIPLIPGRLLLPTVEIEPVVDGNGGASPGGEEVDGGEELGGQTCQTDCTSRSRTVLVVEGMRSTTVAVGRDDVLTRVVGLVESEVR